MRDELIPALRECPPLASGVAVSLDADTAIFLKEKLQGEPKAEENWKCRSGQTPEEP